MYTVYENMTAGAMIRAGGLMIMVNSLVIGTLIGLAHGPTIENVVQGIAMMFILSLGAVLASCMGIGYIPCAESDRQ
jgi:hypothetical protein